MTQHQKNVVVVGGSYVGVATAKELANLLPSSHRVLLVEPHSHFHHLFAFPRFAILPAHEHKCLIPYTTTFALYPDPSRHEVAQAKVLSISPDQTFLLLDREWCGSKTLEFDYLVAATGSTLSPPGTIPYDTKPEAITFLQSYQSALRVAQSIVIVGGGAVGIQMACDLREIYPGKEVTLIQSRDQLMPVYHSALSDLIKARFVELGAKLITGSRVVVPENGFPLEAKKTEVKLQDGRALKADYVITATGQTPNKQWLRSLGNEIEGRRNLFSVGDINDCATHKAAEPGMVQAGVAARNIAALIKGEEAGEKLVVAPASVHLTLGLIKNVIFRNPDTAKGATEPYINIKDDGREDMNIEEVWGRRGPKVTSEMDYHL